MIDVGSLVMWRTRGPGGRWCDSIAEVVATSWSDDIRVASVAAGGVKFANRDSEFGAPTGTEVIRAHDVVDADRPATLGEWAPAGSGERWIDVVVPVFDPTPCECRCHQKV